MRFRLTLIVGLFVLATSGCFFHGGYPYGNYAPGPSVVPQQPFPGGPFYSAPVNGSQPYVPQNSPGYGGPTLTNPGSNPTYDSPSGSNGTSPGFNPDTPSGGKPPVPLPDDGNGYERGTQNPKLTPTSSTSSSLMEPEDETPITQVKSRRFPQSRYDSNESQAEVEDQFQLPSVKQASSVDGNDTDVEFANAPSRAKTGPYGHHPEFEWVQGKVEFEQASNTWYITYDDDPQKSDQLGGDLTLAEHPLLNRLRSGTAVRIYGSIDDTEADSRGKPVFRMTRFNKI